MICDAFSIIFLCASCNCLPEGRHITSLWWLVPGITRAESRARAIALPPGYEAQIRPRSGLAAKNGVTVLNTPGTVDADYRGEVKVILINLGNEDFVIERGMRIAQMVIAPVTQGLFTEVDGLSDTARGAGGFGSTGT